VRDEPAGAAPTPDPGGRMRAAELESAPAEGGARRQLTPAIAAALLVLAASFALSVGFVVANGGMDLPAMASGGPQAAMVSADPGLGGSSAAPASAAPASAAPASATPSDDGSTQTPESSAGSTPSVEPSPVVTPVPSPVATPVPTAALTPNPTSDRYALLTPCADAPDCWIYVIRGGDNLVSIARYFGVPFAVVTDLNPWTTTTQLVAGQELRLPPPTR